MKSTITSLAAALCLIVVLAAPAAAVPLLVTETITWSSPTALQGAFTGTLGLGTLDPTTANGIISLWPSDPVFPGDPIHSTITFQHIISAWPNDPVYIQLTGSLDVAGVLHQVGAYYPPDPVNIMSPGNRREVGVLSPGLDVSGSIFAFSDPTQVGTWNVTVTEVGAPVPEPSTMLLLSAGLGGLLFYRRRARA